MDKLFPRGDIKGRLLHTMAINPVSGCHEWTGGLRHGYGSLNYGGHTLAHRASYEVHKGPIPEGMLVCHHCDNRKCINPDHLFVGTVKDNVQDALAKGRLKGPQGEKSRTAVLTAEIVREIRSGKESISYWAQTLGVTIDTIYKAKGRRTWAHLD